MMVFSIAFDSGGAMYLGRYNTVFKMAAGSTTPLRIAGSANATAGYAGDVGRRPAHSLTALTARSTLLPIIVETCILRTRGTGACARSLPAV